MYDAIKTLGQNFLKDRLYAHMMVDNLNIQPDEDVIEIGAGLGVITQTLDEKMIAVPYKLYSVEIDSRFIPKLESMFLMNPNLIVVQEDILNFLPQFNSSKNIRVIGALPFYITSPIIHTIIKMQKQPLSVVLLIQKEVAKKIAALAPDGSYMSVFVQSFYDVEYICDVPSSNFIPKPTVDGAIISLTLRADVIAQESIRKYEGFLHKAFANPRKMLNKAFTAEELKIADIAPTLRPEAVSAEKWLDAFKKLNFGL